MKTNETSHPQTGDIRPDQAAKILFEATKPHTFSLKNLGLDDLLEVQE